MELVRCSQILDPFLKLAATGVAHELDMSTDESVRGREKLQGISGFSLRGDEKNGIAMHWIGEVYGNAFLSYPHALSG